MPGQKHETLFAGRKLLKPAVGDVAYVEKPQPCARLVKLIGCGLAELRERVAKSSRHNFLNRQSRTEIQLHLGTDITYAILYLPDAFTRPATAVKESDTVGISLRIVRADKAK